MAARRATQLLLRVAGWLLTPLILVSAAAIGAFAGLVLLSRPVVQCSNRVVLPARLAWACPSTRANASSPSTIRTFESLFSAETGLIITVVVALVTAGVVLALWVRLLRDRPQIQAAFDITPEGLPESTLVEKLVHPDRP